jgi:predicted component of type VI protein secretion system
MPSRLVALDEGSDIPLDRTMVVVGRHPQCDARLDSLRVSRHHCCMTQDNGEVLVRDLGSTNGIRINGQRVEIGRLRPGDELSIAHIRYRLDTGMAHEMTLLDAHPHAPPASPDPLEIGNGSAKLARSIDKAQLAAAFAPNAGGENPLAAAVREILPAGMADKCRIQVIVQMEKDKVEAEAPAVCRPDSSH